MKKPIGNGLVPYESPTHVTEVMLALLKLTFDSLPDGHPYKFYDDIDRTGVMFDISMNKASGVWGKKPLIVVSRGMQSCGVLSLGDMSQLNLAQYSRNASNLVQASVEIRVVSKLPGEVNIIAERVFSTLMMLRTKLPQLCGVHMVHSLSMTPPQQLELDDECYEVALSMQYSMQYKWDHATPITLLEGVRFSSNPVASDMAEQPL